MARLHPDQLQLDILLAPPRPVAPPMPSALPFAAALTADLVALDRIVTNRAGHPSLAPSVRIGGADCDFGAFRRAAVRAAPRLAPALLSAMWSMLARPVVDRQPGTAATIAISAGRDLRITAPAGVIADIGGITIPGPAKAWNWSAATAPVYAAHAARADGTLGHWQQWLQVASAWRLGWPELDAVIALLAAPAAITAEAAP